MRLIILTDTHANLPALDAALDAIQKEGYDLLIHTGDAISIGPFPAECLDRLLNLPDAHLLMGNHDVWFAHGLPTPQPEWMSDGEVEHQQWTHAQIDPALRAAVAGWPYVRTETIHHTTLTLLHYPRTGSDEFIPIHRNPTAVDLDEAFAPYPGDLIFYGHHHPFSDLQGRARYINPGSLGCAPTAVARYSVVEIAPEGASVRHRAVPYADAALSHAFAQRAVPEREFINRAFFGGRLQVEYNHL